MFRRTVVGLLSMALGAGIVPLVAVSGEATQGPNKFTSADLATYQTNGVAWTLAQADGLVFVGGTFSAIRPPGAAAGVSETPRANFAVLDAATGAPTPCALRFELPSSPAHATVRSLNVSPDKKTLYVGGFFTAVSGAPAQHLAAIDIATCTQISSFRPAPNGTVRAIASTASTVYFGGTLSAVRGQARTRAGAVAAVGTATPGELRPWAPQLDRDVRAVALKPDGTAVVVGGDFGQANGVATDSLVVLNPSTAANLKTYPAGFFDFGDVTHPAGEFSNVQDIAVDATGFYTGNEGWFDGRTAFDWSTYNQRWRDKCLGATQAVEVYDGILYSGSHAHACLNEPASMPDGRRQHLLAESVNSPVLLPWMPDTNDGIGGKLGPRDLVAATGPAGDFLWVAGEFTTVNGKAQQGLTRFGQGVDTAGPSSFSVTATSPAAGEARIAWRQSLDTDDATLTYRVYRSGVLIHTTTGTSWFWDRRQMTFTDTGRTPGTTNYYRVSASDGTNTRFSGDRGVTISSGSSAYANRVLADQPTAYWRYDDPVDVMMSDSSTNNNNGTLIGSAARPKPGAIPGDPSGALALSGKARIYSEAKLGAVTTYTHETWFNTTTTVGGRIMGISNTQVLATGFYDKHIYMTNAGTLVFGIRRNDGGTVTISSPSPYNDGRWHHVVATQGSSGMALYVDGVMIGANTETTSSTFIGKYGVGIHPMYLRVSGDTLAGWPSQPASATFAGTLDETAFYLRALPRAAILDHYNMGAAQPVAAPPVAAPPIAPLHTLVVRHSGQFADVYKSSTAEGAPVAQFPANGGANQQWRFADAGNGYVNIVNGNSGKCLAVVGSAMEDATAVRQYTCSGATNQQWQVTAVGAHLELKVRHSGKCLSVTGSSMTPGAILVQMTCVGGQNQQWTRQQE